MPSAAERREHEASARALLDVEKITLGVLVEITDKLGRTPEEAHAELQRRLAEAYLGARRAARNRSRSRVAAELYVSSNGARLDGRRDGLRLPELPRRVESDVTKAHDWAASVSGTFLRRANEEGDVRRAVARTRRRLEQSAQAVTADAWADERERVLRAMARENEGSDVLPVIARLWDARLDACPVCKRLDGLIRPIGLSFPNGAEAGREHWGCRCNSALILALFYGGRSQAA